ncbi:MAG: VPLPA-CTERM sorting domain-containing protein [Rhodobacteraceae bacterium]|nr:VPLPA-CTERM sorting domain-containing protein [Paracoccaceae bacterium]
MKLNTIVLGAVASLGMSVAAQAATLTFAETVTELTGAERSCALDTPGFVAPDGDRANICNALGAPDGSFPPEFGFTSTGNFGELEFTFGTEFTGPAYIWEVTGGSTANWTESLDIVAVTAGGVEAEIVSVTNLGADAGGNNSQWKIDFDFEEDGPFAFLRVRNPSGPGDKFDIDAIGVTAVPLPATGLMLIAGLGGIAAMKRRRKS